MGGLSIEKPASGGADGRSNLRADYHSFQIGRSRWLEPLLKAFRAAGVLADWDKAWFIPETAEDLGGGQAGRRAGPDDSYDLWLPASKIIFKKSERRGQKHLYDLRGIVAL